MVEDARRIVAYVSHVYPHLTLSIWLGMHLTVVYVLSTRSSELPLLVDVDTGFGTALNIARTVRDLERIGVAGIHIEDQVLAKRCGHRPGKVRFRSHCTCFGKNCCKTEQLLFPMPVPLTVPFYAENCG